MEKKNSLWTRIKLVVIYKRRQSQLQGWDNACGQCVYHIKRQKQFQCISNKVDVAAGGSSPSQTPLRLAKVKWCEYDQ